MKRSDIKIMPEYFDKYIKQVDDIEVVEALKKYGAAVFDKARLEQIGDKVYEPGKWTVKDTIQHLADCERVFAYRALSFARNDKTNLPGFDENAFAANAGATRKSIDELLSELDAIRQSTVALYKGFNDTMLQSAGSANNHAISVLALGFTMAGHVIHHNNLIKERYYKLIK